MINIAGNKFIGYCASREAVVKQLLDAECDETIVGIVGQGVENHGENHDDILTSLLHREEGDDIVWQILPAKTLKQDPTDA